MTSRNSDHENQNNGSHIRGDLDWLAFCYVADELDPEDRAEFEIRLEDCQLARQAVVDAVQQSQVLYSSLNSTSFNDGKEPVSITSRSVAPPQRFFQRSRILFAAAAAMLMLVAGWAWFTSPNPNGSDALANSDSDQLASAWVATLVVMSNDELDDFIDEELPLPELTSEESEDWMLIALTDLENSEGVDHETY